MWQLPSALACQAASPSCTTSPVRCTAKSMIVVVPPKAAARVPVSKVSRRARCRRTAAPCGCARRSPPGMTYLPVASIDLVGLHARCAAGREQRGDRLAVDQHVGRVRAGRADDRAALDQQAMQPLTAAPARRTRPGGGRGRTASGRGPSSSRLEVQVADDQLRLVRVAGLADELALRVDEVRRAVEVVRRRVVLDADPVDRADEVLVGDRGGRLLELPQVRRQAAAGRRRVEHDLRAGEAERPPALREVPVVADVHADPADRGVEHRVAEVARAEVELLPEALHLRDVGLAVLAEVLAVGVDHRRGVVEHAGLLLLVHRQDHHHAELGGERLEPLGGRARDRLGVRVELRVLDLAEVRAVEQLLEADHLRALRGGLARVLLVGLDHRLLVAGPARLDQRGADVSGHVRPPL